MALEESERVSARSVHGPDPAPGYDHVHVLLFIRSLAGKQTSPVSQDRVPFLGQSSGPSCRVLALEFWSQPFQAHLAGRAASRLR